MTTYRDWLDRNGNIGDTTNWSGGSVPAAGEVMRFLKGSQTISTGLDQSAINQGGIIVGPDFRGMIGSPSSPLKLGSVGYINYNAPFCRAFNVHPTACTEAIVHNSHSLPYAFYLSAGTVTTLINKRGRGVHIGGSATATNVIQSLDGGSVPDETAMVIDAGAAITNLDLDGGLLVTLAGVSGAARQFRGNWQHQATSGDIGSLLLVDGVFQHIGPDSDIPTFEQIGGTFDASQDSAIKSIGATALKLWSRAVFNVNNGSRTITLGAMTIRGTPTILTEPGRTLTIASL